MYHLCIADLGCHYQIFITLGPLILGIFVKHKKHVFQVSIYAYAKTCKLLLERLSNKATGDEHAAKHKKNFTALSYLTVHINFFHYRTKFRVAKSLVSIPVKACKIRGEVDYTIILS